MRECWKKKNWIQHFFVKGGRVLGGVLEAKELDSTLFCEGRAAFGGSAGSNKIRFKFLLEREGGI